MLIRGGTGMSQEEARAREALKDVEEKMAEVKYAGPEWEYLSAMRNALMFVLGE
jgi:hypothetical protein